jgi:cell division protease FtsH
MEPNNRNNRNRGDKTRRRGGGMWSIVLWALLLTIGVNYLSVMLDQARTAESSCEIAYSELVELVEEGKVKSIEFGDTVFTITPVDGFTYTDDDGKSYDQNYTLFTTIIPDATEKLITLCDEHGVTYTKPYQPPVSPILTFMVSYILPTVLMVGAFMLLMNFIAKKSGGMGGIGGVGKANAKVYMEKSTGVTFADVAGQDEAKESLVEIIDFLHNPEKYTAIGAKIPKGALLVGSPGTGKTLLAKAVAGEAKVPFFSISGSDFVEMFVGVGASRVRDLFAEASKVAPCIIFIDEIDTIGKSRDGGRYGGGNDEREQTLNQLLAEMDGFDPSKGVIVLAATNRPEVLDKALLRPGRFDRRITVDRPNLAGRLATLQVHTRGIKLAEDVDLKKVALATAGCVGADLANLANEAALRAVRKGRKLVTQEDMLAAFEFVIAGSEKKGSVLTEFEKKLVAYHEVGHAMVAYKQKNAEPVQKITIVPHTEGSLGYTLLMPEEDKTNLRTRDELMAKIAVSMGGRAAEEVVMNTMTNGASQDIQEATSIARNMVAMYGMSDAVGMVALGSVRNQYLDGGYAGYRRHHGPRGQAYPRRVLQGRRTGHPRQPRGYGQGRRLPP